MHRITVASYNLHGTQSNDEYRFYRIAQELQYHRADICGFQEVINGMGVEDTSYQVARHLMNLTGERWYTYWAYCHPFYDRYPEGISVLSRVPLQEVGVINLDVAVRKTRPLMQRYALAVTAELGGKAVRFVTTHLDHHKTASIRTQQAQKIIDNIYSNTNRYFNAEVITGDLNAKETSSCLKLFKRNKFQDSFRKINKRGGDTFPASGPYCRIDFILCRGQIKIVDSFLMSNQTDLSDHIGIVTVIDIK